MTERILAIDTTGPFGSLALASGGQLVEEALLHAPEGFGHVLFDHLQRLLRKHGWDALSLGCVGAASGPGSFTGIRVGLAAAKGLAEAASCPVVAVSNLQALAWHGAAPLRAAVLDARRGEVFGALYDSALELCRPEVVMALPEWLETLPESELEFIFTDPDTFRPALAGTRFETAAVTRAPRALAAAVASIAARRMSEGLALDPALADANYVRRSDAELFWRDPHA